MGSTVVVRYTTRADAAGENQRLVENVFAELAATKPDGLRYATFLLADGVTFVHVAMMDGEGNPLSEVGAFEEFARGVGERCVDPPAPAQATVVGSYRLFADG